MIVSVLECHERFSRVQVSEQPDGTNPPRIFEVVIRHDPYGSETAKWGVELRAGDAVEFAAHEDDAESYPDTVYQGVFA